MTVVLWVLGINWLLPLVCCWAYLLLAWLLFKDVTFHSWYGPFPVFKLDEVGLVPAHASLWHDWGGVGLMGFAILRDRPETWDDARVARTKVHEGTHCWQWLLGLAFYLSYLLHMAFIYLFHPKKHPYLDCWAERMARKRAGQQLDFTRAEWPQGKDDRWPWW